jgi:hypothetical protein
MAHTPTSTHVSLPTAAGVPVGVADSEIAPGLCSRQPIGAYTWSRHPSTLALSVAHDDCSERDAIPTGTWKRT